MTFSPAGMIKVDHLRYSKVWIALGIFLLGTIVFLSVVDIPRSVKSVMLHDKVAHMIAYASLMAWFSQIFKHDLTRVLLAGMFLLLGVGVEFLQALTPTRQFEYLDMVANASGVLLAWALSYTWIGSILEWFERTCLIRAQQVV